MSLTVDATGDACEFAADGGSAAGAVPEAFTASCGAQGGGGTANRSSTGFARSEFPLIHGNQQDERS